MVIIILPYTPENLQIEISSRCNLNCFLCPKGRGEINRKRKDISLNYFKDVIDEIKEKDPYLQLWNYGEPFLHPNISQIIDSIPPVFTNCDISTNGHYMNKDLAKTIISSGITKVIFGIDGLTQKTYEKYRKGGKLEKVLENIRTLSKIREKYTSDLKINVQFIALKHNFDQIPRLGDFFYPMGVDEIKVKSAMMMFDENNNHLNSIAKEYLSLNYPGERYELRDDGVHIKGERIDNCPLLEESIVITTDEKFLICCWDFKSEYPIPTTDMVEEVRPVVNFDDPPKMCLRCPVRFQKSLSWDWDKVPGVEYP